MIRRIIDRLTGREAAALRYQRDAHAEEAGRERQRRMEAERDRDDWREHSARGWEERNIHVARGNEYLRQKNEQHVLADARGQTIWRLQNRLTRWQRRYYQMRDARDEALSQTAECNRQREQKAAEHMWTLREMTDMAAHVKRELDAATALIERLTTARDEHALADAATWLRARAPIRMATEQEGSRGGLAWMPGEALPDE